VKKRQLPPLILALLVSACSTGKVSYYKQGDLHSRQFLELANPSRLAQGEYFQVKRNDKDLVVSVKHYGPRKQLLEKSSYTYSRKGILLRYQIIEYFAQGSPRISREWFYEEGRVVKRNEQWFTRAHTMEKKLTIHYDPQNRAYLEETWGLGGQLASSTEYYYDHKNRLDKSVRNFFLPTGELRDFWVTIYNDEIQIINEDHYLAGNALVGFYRYAYHPVKMFREHEEILDEERNIFISRTYNEYGQLMIEEEKDRNLKLIQRTRYEYTEHHQPRWVYQYGPDGKLIRKSKYKQPRILENYRTPGL